MRVRGTVKTNGDHPSSSRGYVTVSVRKYLERIIKEVDDRQTASVTALKELTNSKLQAMDEATKTAFNAAEKSSEKTDQNQKDYNAGHNDLTRKMESQYKEMAPRQYVDDKVHVLEEKLEAIRLSKDAQIESTKSVVDSRVAEIREDIQSLRESRSQQTGKSLGVREVALIFAALIGWTIAIISIVLKVKG
jgi:tetrahydromethanopterin S-methyltransferase subunit G